MNYCIYFESCTLKTQYYLCIFIQKIQKISHFPLALSVCRSQGEGGRIEGLNRKINKNGIFL